MSKRLLVLCVLFGFSAICAAESFSAGRKLLQDSEDNEDDSENDSDVNDDEDNSAPPPSVSGNSILDAARQIGTLSVFYRAAARAGLNDTLTSGSTQATVFAPTDDAFDDFLERFDLRRSQFINTPAFAKLVLQYHVIPSSTLRAGQLSDNQMLTTALNNYRVSVNTDRDSGDDNDSSVEIQAAYSDAEIQRTDISAGQAVVHTIGTVLIPPRGFWLPAIQGQTGTAATAASG